MRHIIFVGLGGFLGSVARFQLGALATQLFGPRVPAGTLVVNLLGCFLVGYLSGLIEKRYLFSAETRLFLITGFLGGFTTFSAFGLETTRLLERGKWPFAMANVVANVVGGLLLVWLGFRVAAARPSDSHSSTQSTVEIDRTSVRLP
ncbi:MAG TPA: fluoride efflux transporter CrcB [Abditibacteriaceae bacterium]|jgi:CrcB protein